MNGSVYGIHVAGVLSKVLMAGCIGGKKKNEKNT
tara:strand:+ start:1629 stop:1730 length:102 start_codon:yes stop_codon:yes gene_type:complete